MGQNYDKKNQKFSLEEPVIFFYLGILFVAIVHIPFWFGLRYNEEQEILWLEII